MFIPKVKVQIGSFIKTTKVVYTEAGHFTKGHIFKCIDITHRGPDFQDENGMRLLETGHLGKFYKIIDYKPHNKF